MRDSKTLTSADVDKIMQAARAEVQKNDWTMSIAIVDQSGLIWRVERTEGAIPASPKIAEAKARTAALMRAPTGAIEGRAADRLVMLGLPDLLLMQGGLPIFAADDCVGAVGVSGGLSPQDEQVARAGIDALA